MSIDNQTKGFLANASTCSDLLAEIDDALNVRVMAQAINGGPNQTTWADVGDVEHYRQQLTELRDQICKKGEYA